MKKRGALKNQSAFTIIEVLVDVAVFTIIALAVLTAYSAGLRAMELAKSKIAAVALANAKMEDLRNMPYDALATKQGAIYPPGNIEDNQVAVQRGVEFNIKTTIVYEDDPYDGNAEGSIAGKPKDIYPYDYKKAEITVSKVGMKSYLVKLTSTFSAKAAETPSNTGIIKICVVNSANEPLINAVITIKNPEFTPPVDVLASTGADGCLMVPNLPPDTHNHYNLTASMPGYSLDSTYPRTAQNPNALQPDVNVLVQQVTNQTLKIDVLSTMNIQVVDTAGLPRANTTVHIVSLKEKWFNPSTPIYSADIVTDANGRITLPNMEFGDYYITVPGSTILSTSPYQAVDLKAGVTLDVKIVTGDTSHLSITSSNPQIGITGESLSLDILGANFVNGLSVRLIKATGEEVFGTGVVVTGQKSIAADFNLTGMPVGMWDILVTNPDGSSIRQENALEVKN